MLCARFSSTLSLRAPLALGARPTSHAALGRPSVTVVAKLNTPSSKYRQRLNEKQRMYNKSIKSAARTRIKNVIKFTDNLEREFAKSAEAMSEEDFIKKADELVADAFSHIDKAVSKGVMKKTTAARRKSRVTRLKRQFRERRGWSTPEMAN